MTKNKSVILGLITFIVTLAITITLAVVYLTVTSNSRKEKASFIAQSVAERIEAEIDIREFITRVFEITISGKKAIITDEEFDKLASELFDDYLDVIDISLAPNGIVAEVYPKDSGLEKGMDFFMDELGGLYADYSKLSQVPVIISPTSLVDGTYGCIIRRPIILDNDTFWGFASITLNLNAFLGDVDIAALSEEGYDYKLISNNILTNENSIIDKSAENELIAPVQAMLSTVGGGIWYLDIAPKNGWLQLYEILAAFAIALIISVLAAMFMYAYMSMQANAKELEVLSYRDALTNLYNPRSYQEHMEELTKKKLPYGLVFMDLNDFKKVNDTYGHETGDALLNITAKRLKNSIREKDRAFRIGGDEFVVVLHGAHDKKFYEGVMDRMRQSVAREVTIGDIKLNVSISAGFARCPEDGTKLEDVVKKADEAMYNNKREMKALRGSLSPQDK
ncbi:MAG: sensor domain-containing diguanylate cyclase [Butyrivibrio sp.]|nr:sensor domain-containing diguanylate cyclase [Butyrivibrio sp.]